MDRRHRTLFSRPAAASAPGESAGASGGDESDVFPWTLYREIVAARRDRLLYDTGILDKMITVLETAVPAADTDAPAAAAAAVEAATKAGAREIQALADAQDRLAERLASVLKAMSEWQSLSELTLTLRRLIEEQELIDKNIRSLPDPGTPK
jgi:hypothetical protein